MTVDYNDRSPLEERLLALLEPDDVTVERVKARALSASTRPRRSLRVLAVAGSLLAAIGTYAVWQLGIRQPLVITIERSENDLMMVRTPDGREWLLGPIEPEPALAGTMEVILEGGQ